MALCCHTQVVYSIRNTNCDREDQKFYLLSGDRRTLTSAIVALNEKYPKRVARHSEIDGVNHACREHLHHACMKLLRPAAQRQGFEHYEPHPQMWHSLHVRTNSGKGEASCNVGPSVIPFLFLSC